VEADACRAMERHRSIGKQRSCTALSLTDLPSWLMSTGASVSSSSSARQLISSSRTVTTIRGPRNRCRRSFASTDGEHRGHDERFAPRAVHHRTNVVVGSSQASHQRLFTREVGEARSQVSVYCPPALTAGWAVSLDSIHGICHRSRTTQRTKAV
jgi:hypothetical protein